MVSKKKKSNSIKKSPTSLLNYLKRFWKYMWYDDSLGAYLTSFVVALIFIKFIFFPVLGLFLGTQFPVVAIVSGSMEHKVVNGVVCGESSQKRGTLSLDEWWEICGVYYESNFNITKEEFKTFDFKSGLNTGDVMVLRGKDPSKIDVGDILVFVPGDLQWYQAYGPVIHRVVAIEEKDEEYFFTTKGDHNSQIQSANNFETGISENQVLAVGSVRIPYLGYPKKWLTDLISLI